MPTQVLRLGFTKGLPRPPQEGEETQLDMGFAALRYSEARASALSAPAEAIQRVPAFVLENPIFPGETQAFHFYEPRYLQPPSLGTESAQCWGRYERMLQEVDHPDGAESPGFVYMADAAAAELFVNGRTTGVLMRVMEHRGRYSHCLAGSKVCITNGELEQVETGAGWKG